MLPRRYIGPLGVALTVLVPSLSLPRRYNGSALFAVADVALSLHWSALLALAVVAPSPDCPVSMSVCSIFTGWCFRLYILPLRYIGSLCVPWLVLPRLCLCPVAMFVRPVCPACCPGCMLLRMSTLCCFVSYNPAIGHRGHRN